MRKLTEEELEIATKLQLRQKLNDEVDLVSLRVQYEVQGNVTLAAVWDGGKIAMGYSKYNPNDKDLNLPFIENVGEHRALVKALISLDSHLIPVPGETASA